MNLHLLAGGECKSEPISASIGSGVTWSSVSKSLPNHFSIVRVILSKRASATKFEESWGVGWGMEEAGEIAGYGRRTIKIHCIHL